MKPVFTYVGGACPTQAWGRTADGRPFYFRARHGEWALTIGEAPWSEDILEWPVWPEPYAKGADKTYGFMDNQDVRLLVCSMLDLGSVEVQL